MRAGTYELGDLCEVNRTRSADVDDDTVYVGLEHITSHSGLLRPTTVEAAGVRSATFAFDASCVLYGKLRPYLNKVALPNAPGVCSTDILPLVPRAGVDRRVLAALLRSCAVRERVDQMTTGANLPRIAPAALLSIHVTLPTKRQQEKVCAAVDALSSAYQALNELGAAVDEMASGIDLLLARSRRR